MVEEMTLAQRTGHRGGSLGQVRREGQEADYFLKPSLHTWQGAPMTPRGQASLPHPVQEIQLSLSCAGGPLIQIIEYMGGKSGRNVPLFCSRRSITRLQLPGTHKSSISVEDARNVCKDDSFCNLMIRMLSKTLEYF